MAGRSCCAIELDPLYVDVTVRRWEEFTGEKAILDMARKPLGQEVAGRGRPTKLTPEAQRAICESIALSIPNKYAAEEAGIDEDTFALWMRKGRAGRAPTLHFIGR